LGAARRRSAEDRRMADAIYVALTIAFFALSWWYVRACDRM
jgi:hypothetical protein